MLRKFVRFGVLAAAIAAVAGAPAFAQSNRLLIELNKVEASSAGCQFHLIVANESATDLNVLSADLVFFDREGVVLTRSTVSFGGMRANKTHFRSFVFPELACDGVGRVLVNDIVQCQPANNATFDCGAALEVSSRASIELVQ